jgi:hypothetical protein
MNRSGREGVITASNIPLRRCRAGVRDGQRGEPVEDAGRLDAGEAALHVHVALRADLAAVLLPFWDRNSRTTSQTAATRLVRRTATVFLNAFRRARARRHTRDRRRHALEAARCVPSLAVDVAHRPLRTAHAVTVHAALATGRRAGAAAGSSTLTARTAPTRGTRTATVSRACATRHASPATRTARVGAAVLIAARSGVTAGPRLGSTTVRDATRACAAAFRGATDPCATRTARRWSEPTRRSRRASTACCGPAATRTAATIEQQDQRQSHCEACDSTHREFPSAGRPAPILAPHGAKARPFKTSLRGTREKRGRAPRRPPRAPNCASSGRFRVAPAHKNRILLHFGIGMVSACVSSARMGTSCN